MHYSFSVNWAYLRFVFHLIVACGGEVDIRPAIVLCTYCQRCQLINQLAEMVTTGKLYWTSCTWRCCRSDSLSPSAASGNHMCQHWLWENKGCLDRLEKDIATFDNCSLWLLAQPTGHPPRGSMLPTETWGKRGVQCRATRSPNPAAPAQTTVLVLHWAAGEHQSRETDDCGAVPNVLHHLARDVLVVLFLSLSFQLCFFYSWVLDSSCSKVTVITSIMHHVNHHSHSKHSFHLLRL